MPAKVEIIFVICGILYLGYAISLVIRGIARRTEIYLVGALVATAAWTGEIALGGYIYEPGFSLKLFTTILRTLELLTAVFWICFLLELVLTTFAGIAEKLRLSSARIFGGAVVGGLCIALMDNVPVWAGYDANSWIAGARYTLHLGISLAGIIIVENLVRNATEEGFWSIKYLGLGLGLLFAYDFFCYAHALLFRDLDPSLVEIRGAVVLLILPLIVVGARRAVFSDVRMRISHNLALHTLAIIGGGIYLSLMGAVGAYLARFRDVGLAGFISFVMLGALLLLVVVLLSGAARSYAKVWLYQNLFAYKYDYRKEWLRFINTVAAEQSGANLRLRVIKSLAAIVDSPGGCLWEWQDLNQAYEFSEHWNFSDISDDHPMDSELCAFMANTGSIINLNKFREGQVSEAVSIKGWILETTEMWLLIPLIHRARLLAVLCLQQPRSPRQLNWEDFQLLDLSARQAASYLAETIAQHALSTARELEIFNRRFAFVIHDIKTLGAQLSLLLKNAEKHGNHPDFQRDMLESVRDAAAAMQRLIGGINDERRRSPEKSTDLNAVVGRIVHQRRAAGFTNIEHFESGVPGEFQVVGDEYSVVSVVNHLVQNALDAAGPNGEVKLRLECVGNKVSLSVCDNGPGMDEEFVRSRLFEPFKTTKHSGYGIGAYQCRELVRELGGQIRVSSTPGRGTCILVTLPSVAREQPSGVEVIAQ